MFFTRYILPSLMLSVFVLPGVMADLDVTDMLENKG